MVTDYQQACTQLQLHASARCCGGVLHRHHVALAVVLPAGSLLTAFTQAGGA